MFFPSWQFKIVCNYIAQNQNSNFSSLNLDCEHGKKVMNNFAEKTIRKKELQRKRKERQRICDKEKEENEPPVVKKISEEKFMGSVKAFKERNKSLTYKRCTGCRKV